MVLILPQHADHQDLLIPQQVDHLVLHQHYERPEYQLWNFLFLLIKSSFYDSFLLWWMAVLLFRAKPVSGSTSRKWDKTCLALLTRMYRLASLSPRWDGCQIQSIALNRAGEMFAETQFSCWKLATDALVALQYQAWILNTLKRTRKLKKCAK